MHWPSEHEMQKLSTVIFLTWPTFHPFSWMWHKMPLHGRIGRACEQSSREFKNLFVHSMKDYASWEEAMNSGVLEGACSRRHDH